MRLYVLANKTNGFSLCTLNRFRLVYIASKSTCYRIKSEMEQNFPHQIYNIYELVKVESRRKQ